MNINTSIVSSNSLVSFAQEFPVVSTNTEEENRINFLELPILVRNHVYFYLKDRDIISLYSTCKELRNIFEKFPLWKNKLFNEFPASIKHAEAICLSEELAFKVYKFYKNRNLFRNSVNNAEIVQQKSVQTQTASKFVFTLLGAFVLTLLAPLLKRSNDENTSSLDNRFNVINNNAGIYEYDFDIFDYA